MKLSLEREAYEKLGEILDLHQWVCFRADKKPVTPHTLKLAKANNPETWAEFNEAWNAWKNNPKNICGVGFEFAGGYLGIDLDHVIDDAGNLAEWAAVIVQNMDTYTEYSPSGSGLHLLCKVNEPMEQWEAGGASAHNRKMGPAGEALEMYDAGRYFTITARPFGELKPIQERTAAARAVYIRYLQKDKETTAALAHAPAGPVSSTAAALWAEMEAGPNGAKIAALRRGDIAAYDFDDSAADMALCGYLARYTRRDKARMDEMFRQSGLMREKWDRPTGGTTYGAMTIDKACVNDARIEAERAAREKKKTPDPLPLIPASADLQALIDNIRVGEKFPPVATGFSSLDKILSGGLRPGLYVLGAVPSLGKTAFCMQMLDNIAAAGQDVIVFSLEMSRAELIARSVSRLTYELSRAAMSPGRLSYSMVELMTGICYGKDGAEGQRRIMDAVKAYTRYADRVYIVEGVGDLGVSQMVETVKGYIDKTGRRPVVLVDYLQIIPPDGDKSRTDKQIVDFNVVALKRLSRDLAVPVVAISSFNRINYAEPLNTAAFKESGAVEYSADCLIGLQFRGQDYHSGDEKEGSRVRRISALIARMNRRGKEGKPQGVQLKVLKNRAGYKDSCFFEYYPAFNFFLHDAEGEEKEREAETKYLESVERAARVGMAF